MPVIDCQWSVSATAVVAATVAQERKTQRDRGRWNLGRIDVLRGEWEKRL
jgi:hypothetical protein